MAVRAANIKGIKFLEEPMGADKSGIALVTFDLSAAYTASTDSVKIGSGGTDGGATNTSTLAAVIQKRRRDGKTVTLHGATSGPPGANSEAASIYARDAAVSTADVTLDLDDAPSGGSELTLAVTTWTRAAGVYVMYRAS